jgi:hypothetical protein
MKNLDGNKYGRLTVIKTFLKETGPDKILQKFCECVCSCGKTVEVLANNLIIKRTASCGCKKLKGGTLDGIPINSKTFPVEYNAWKHMNHRCYNEKTEGYKYYGARGISVCESWRGSFEKFLLDIGKKPTEEHQLDRIDNDGNYEPENCRWVTPKENSANRRNSLFITFDGETLSLADWALKLNINYNTLRTRYYDGKPIEEVLEGGRRSSPINPDTYLLEYRGESKTINEWSPIIGLSKEIILNRLRDSWDVEKIFTTPLRKRKESGEIKNKNISYNGIIKTLGEWALFLGKDYNTIKNRYLAGHPLEVVLSSDKYSPGRNNLNNEANIHIGEKHNSLTIMEVFNEKDKKGVNRLYASCKCDCGNIKTVLLTNVIKNKAKTCGCSRSKGIDTNSEEVSDKKYSLKGIVGKKFDRLTVLEVFKEKTAKGNDVYKLRCSCDCGNETTINLTHIGVVKSCGCYHKEVLRENRMDVTSERLKEVKKATEEGYPFWEVDTNSNHIGKKFNKLTIKEVRICNKEGGGRKYAKCLCDCGKETIKKLYNVTSKKTKSCGCAKKDAANEMSRNNSLEVAGTKFCKVGDVFGNFTVKDIYKRKNNIYAMCSVEGGGEKEIRVDHLKDKN